MPQKSSQGEESLVTVLLNRLIGSDEPQYPPDIAEAISLAKKERPDLANVELYGPLSRLLLSKADGYMSPAGSIYLNQESLKRQTPQEIADTLIHEQTHVDQKNREGRGTLGELMRLLTPNGPYEQRAEELEAFQAEKLRRARMNRSQLPVRSFLNPGKAYFPMDVNLPVEKRKK